MASIACCLERDILSAVHTLEQLRAGQLAGVRRLKLSCGLTTLPREIFDLADSLEILDLSGNALSTLPDDLPRLHKLRIIFCSDNLFTTLPDVLGSCLALEMIGFKANRIRHVPAAALPPTLRWLTLTDNVIESMPDELGKCSQLQKLMLAGNCLSHLPATLADLPPAGTRTHCRQPFPGVARLPAVLATPELARVCG